MKRFARASLSAAVSVALLSPAFSNTALASPFSVRSGQSQLAALQTVGEGSSVLGLEGQNADKAAELTAALRKQLSKRGTTQAQDMTLAELKLTMGCDDGDLACIAEGGKTMKAAELIYGKLDGASGEYTLTLTVLDVEKAKVVNGLTTTLDDAALTGDALEATAADLVNRLLGPAEGSDAPVGAGTGAAGGGTGDAAGDPGDGTSDDPTASEGEQAVEGPDKSGKLVWGMQRPPAKWKVIGLGVSGGLMLASLGTAIGTSLVIRNPNGKVYKELLQEAENSLSDENPRNDISPDSDGDLCELARAEPADQPGKVTNADMTRVCNKADSLATTATASYIATGVFGASTIAFTVLLFTHKSDSATVAKMRKHDVQLGFAPGRRGAFQVGGGFRF